MDDSYSMHQMADEVVSRDQGAMPPLDQAPQEHEEERVTQNQTLWKPISEKGTLVVLYPYPASPVTIYDEQGNILEAGQSTGASNGYADTVRFSQPGNAYQRVTISDGTGRSIFVEDGSLRQTF